jgi:hypothetical protein
MYPEDQQNPANRNTIGEAPAPFNMNPNNGQQPKKEPKKANWVLLGIISGALLLVTIIVGGVILLANAGKGEKEDPKTSQNDPKDEEKTETDTDEACSSKLRRYQNEDLDIRFCYPNAWGDVKSEDSKLDPSDDGTRVKLSFVDKSSVHLGLVSDDWSTDVGRDGTCVDPSAQAFPDTSTFSARWVNTPATGAPTSAIRGLEITPDELLIQEHVDNTLANGTCLEGYKAFGGQVYRNAMATYYSAFNAKVTTPQQHITSPTQLISASDRGEFSAFVKSIEKF